MSLLYLDTCCIIYLLEGTEPFHTSVTQRLMKRRATTGATILTSRLARLECRTKPLRENDVSLLARYETFFTAQRFRLVDITSAVIERATELRAKYGFKTPDALHLATAILEHVDVVLTGDHALEKCREIPIEVIA